MHFAAGNYVVEMTDDLLPGIGIHHRILRATCPKSMLDWELASQHFSERNII
jgi:hypothetical protein